MVLGLQGVRDTRDMLCCRYLLLSFRSLCGVCCPTILDLGISCPMHQHQNCSPSKDEHNSPRQSWNIWHFQEMPERPFWWKYIDRWVSSSFWFDRLFFSIHRVYLYSAATGEIKTECCDFQSQSFILGWPDFSVEFPKFHPRHSLLLGRGGGTSQGTNDLCSPRATWFGSKVMILTVEVRVREEYPSDDLAL